MPDYNYNVGTVRATRVVEIDPSTGLAVTRTAGTTGSGQADAAAPIEQARLYLLNAAGTWDAQRGNTEGTLLVSAARTTFGVSPLQTNHNARGILLFLDVTVWGGAGSLSAQLKYYDPLSTKQGNAHTFATITAAGLYVYAFYPGATTGYTATVSGVLPRSFYVLVLPGDATSHTYSLGYSLIV